MKTLLRIDSSARTQDSWSRRAGDALSDAWEKQQGKGSVVHRDLALHPLPHIESETIEGMFTDAPLPERLASATALSDQLIHEIEQADAVLITTPLYNFGIPSSLKAWIDQISRIGRTFAFDGKQFQPLIPGKPVTLVVAYGAQGYGAEGDFRAANFVEPYLQFMLGFLGFRVQVQTIEATSINAAFAQMELDTIRLGAPEWAREVA